MHTPRWIEQGNYSYAEKRSAILRYKVTVAALHASEAGGLHTLASMIGYTYQGLLYAIHRGDMTPGMASLIENLVGRDVVKIEELCSKFSPL